MSWNDWCKTIKDQGFVAGGVYGQDGSVWAEFCDDEECQFSAEEVPKIMKCIQKNNPSEVPVCVKGKKQTVLKADPSDGILLGKKGADSCVVAVKCNQSIIVGIGGKKSEPRSLLEPLSKVGESLKGTGY
ncbi:uncharacterized protein LOC123554187 [Mercenaria mercenaria]|uniref:uncharacterized protein LOC123554187 n=1 Tax=Mercenaria mercenaria TaxID=6596 RepID=UPI001E1DD08F|nr:uncharacterized protein LOC123554187 [Mercenaria mercenaria]